MSGADIEQGLALTPEEASAALGNPIRAAILRALWASPEEELSFSELRRRAGDPDSGQFNYHLGELVGALVERTEEGYRPVQTGLSVLRTALFGPVDHRPVLDALAVDGACHHCGGGLVASYDGQNALVRCEACDKIQLQEAVPPAVFEVRTPAEAVRVSDRWVLARSMLLVEGVCPDCAGEPEMTLFRTRHAQNRSLDYLRAHYVCGSCAYECDVPVWLQVLLARHSAVVSFYYERGVDLVEAPVWELTKFGTEARVTIESEAPVRIGVVLPYDGDALRLTLDEGLDVLGASPVQLADQVADD